MTTDTNTETPRRGARRRLLLAIAAAGAAVPGRHVLPERWRQPLVESVLLPAHAQTTSPPGEPEEECPSTSPIASTPSSITARTEDEPPEDFDNVDINFDGCDNLTLAVTDSDENLGGPDVDIVLSLDVDPFEDDADPEFDTFDVTHLGGSNWDVESHDFGAGSDLPEGDYSLTIRRTAGGNVDRRFEINLTVTVTQVEDIHQQIELSGVTATPLPM